MNIIEKKIITEVKLIKEIKRKYHQLEWVRTQPLYKPQIPDYIVMQDRTFMKLNQAFLKSALVEFKCDNNLLKNYTDSSKGIELKERKDKREKQFLFIKNYMSNSCIINYNNKVQRIEEYIWGNNNSYSLPQHIINYNMPFKLFLFNSCTLKDIKILSLEDML